MLREPKDLRFATVIFTLHKNVSQNVKNYILPGICLSKENRATAIDAARSDLAILTLSNLSRNVMFFDPCCSAGSGSHAALESGGALRRGRSSCVRGSVKRMMRLARARMATMKMLPSGPVAPPLRMGLPTGCVARRWCWTMVPLSATP